jgi:alpha-ketoglutarate-dependent dioxygenase FTO
MFALPWTNDIGSTDATISIGKLNDTLRKRTEFLLKKTKNGKDYGCCTYNLTLINRCYPDKTSDKYPKMKLEPTFNEEKITVSWHADSTLEHFSSIAVYQHTTDDETTDDKDRWKLALRVHAHAEGPLQGKECKLEITAPPLAIPLPSNTCYYLLDEFNHHHQHSVLAGKSQRYSSTHRVAKVDGHTYQSIFAKCQSALNGSGYSGKQIRSEQLAFGELEFEWLRQFYIQGSKHKNKNVWWDQKMVNLLTLWNKFESKTMKSLEVLEAAVLLSQNNGIDDADSKQKIKKRKKRIATVDENSFNELIEGLQNRHEKRDGWIKRADDPIFKSEPIDCRPLRIPFDSEHHPDSDEAQKKLKESINKLLLLKQQYDLLGIGNKRKVDDDINDQDETNDDETKVIKKSKH